MTSKLTSVCGGVRARKSFHITDRLRQLHIGFWAVTARPASRCVKFTSCMTFGAHKLVHSESFFGLYLYELWQYCCLRCRGTCEKNLYRCTSTLSVLNYVKCNSGYFDTRPHIICPRDWDNATGQRDYRRNAQYQYNRGDLAKWFAAIILRISLMSNASRTSI